MPPPGAGAGEAVRETPGEARGERAGRRDLDRAALARLADHRLLAPTIVAILRCRDALKPDPFKDSGFRRPLDLERLMGS